MRLLTTSAILSLVCSSFSAPAGAAELQPVGSWQLDYGDAQCTAARPFGEASAPIALGIVPSIDGASYQILVSQPRAGPKYAQQFRGSVDFGQGEVAAPMLYYGGAGQNLSVIQARIPAAAMAQARSSAVLTVSTGRGDRFTFPLSDMQPLFDNLAKCTTSLKQYWNLGPNAPATPARATVADLRALVTPADFPTAALDRHQRGSAQYQLLVDEQGKVAGCDIYASSGVPILDSTGCEVLKQKAHFAPAKDSSGKAVRSVVTTPVIAWNTTYDNPFNTGCSAISGNTNELVSMCNRQDPFRNSGPIGAPEPPPPPPPPPPPSH